MKNIKSKRPKDELDYFALPVNPSLGEQFLDYEHGNAGYATYIRLLRLLWKRATGKLDCSDPRMERTLARHCHITVKTFREIIADAAKFGLFEEGPWHERSVITSAEHARLILQTVGKSEQASANLSTVTADLSDQGIENKQLSSSEVLLW